MRKKARSKKSFMIAAVGVGIVGVGASVFTAGLAAIVFIPLTVRFFFFFSFSLFFSPLLGSLFLSLFLFIFFLSLF